MSNETMNLTKVIVPCRFSYLHCWEPNAVNGGEAKYSVSKQVRYAGSTAAAIAITVVSGVIAANTVSKGGF